VSKLISYRLLSLALVALAFCAISMVGCGTEGADGDDDGGWESCSHPDECFTIIDTIYRECNLAICQDWGCYDPYYLYDKCCAKWDKHWECAYLCLDEYEDCGDKDVCIDHCFPENIAAS